MNPEDFSNSPKHSSYDAVVVGSGPNGLAAAIFLAQNGAKVLVIEAKSTPGGGLRCAEFTLPGFTHDVCAAIHPMGIASPFLKLLDLEGHGLFWTQPTFPVVQPLDDGRAVVHERSVAATAARLGADERAYRNLFDRLTEDSAKLYASLLGPLTLPRHPFAMLNFGRHALKSAKQLADQAFQTTEAKALFSGHAAHSVQALESTATAAVGLMLGVSAHSVGWPVARGGTQSIARALISIFRELDGEIICDAPITSFNSLPTANAYLFDTSPKALASICQSQLPSRYREKLKSYRYGPGVFKVDWALSESIPWTNEAARDTACVHVGGTFDEVAQAERECWEGHHSRHPFLILAQPTVVDPTRAPEGRHTAWAYCHVPNGSTVDMQARIEEQVERFAPGFRDCILESHSTNTNEMEHYNANYIGGDVVGGVQDLGQLYSRPVARLNPYTTPAKNIFLCSASTPPGAGVHGMCGYHAAKTALKRLG
ncbi:MAG: NAD(P)/FAD-dependent oxidoreductase [Verrucomicrobiota bacterium]